MRTATLAALVMAAIVAILAMALWPQPAFEHEAIVVAPSPTAPPRVIEIPESLVAPDAPSANATPVAPGAAPAAMDRGPTSREQMGSRPIAAAAAAGMTSDVALLELVAIIPHPGNAPAPRSLTRTEAIDSVMQSPDYQETVSPLARLYFATFGRYPDYEGLNYYTGQREGGSGLAEIADEFARGREFDMRYGDLSNAEFVARIVSNVLGNESQADVRAYWTSELEAGRMTRGQVIVDLAESGMFRERTANQVFVSAAYAEVLQRSPDPQGYAHWVDFLAAGNPARGVIDGLLARR